MIGHVYEQGKKGEVNVEALRGNQSMKDSRLRRFRQSRCYQLVAFQPIHPLKASEAPLQAVHASR
jgi:hypothetical protein